MNPERIVHWCGYEHPCHGLMIQRQGRALSVVTILPPAEQVKIGNHDQVAHDYETNQCPDNSGNQCCQFDLVLQPCIDGSRTWSTWLDLARFSLCPDFQGQRDKQTQEPDNCKQHQCPCPRQGSGLLKFNQSAIAILGVKKQDRFAMGTGL